MKKNGFTLIELLVVIAIIGLLAAVVAMNVGNTDPPKWKISKTEVLKLKGHVELFKLEQNRYPTSLEELVMKRYLDELPKDAWGRDFVYRAPGQRGAPFDIVCWGADGQPDGREENEDIWSHPAR